MIRIQVVPKENPRSEGTLLKEVSTRKGVDKYLKGYCKTNKCKYTVVNDICAIDNENDGYVYIILEK